MIVAGNCAAERERERRTTTPGMLSGESVFVERRGRVRVGAQDIVLEPELFHRMTYGWQVGESKSASGGCYIHVREGVGDFESEKLIGMDPSIRSGDFYNVTRDRRPIEARLYFTSPGEGMYHLMARTMAHKTQCSNIISVRVNDGSRRRVGRNGTTPFVWLWHFVGEVNLRKGLNVMSFMVYQDDVKVDQVVLARARPDIDRDSRVTFTGGFDQGPVSGPEVPPLNMSLAFDTLTVTAGRSPRVHLYIHKSIAEALGARLIVSLDLPGGKRRKNIYEVTLPKSRRLMRYSLPVELPGAPDRREYLLRCALLVDSRVVDQETLVLFRGYDWSVLGPLPFTYAEDAGPLDGAVSPRKSHKIGDSTFTWRRYDGRHSDHFCLMDFVRMFGQRVALTAALYAYTEVEARKAGEYLMKVQGDDNIVVWLNGGEVVEIIEKGPPIRTAREVRVNLKEGRNRILFRLNQKKAQWQAGIRIRTARDQVAAGVVGVPFDKQSAGLTSP